MNFTVTKENKFSVVTIDLARLDASSANEFKKDMMDLVDSGNSDVVLDVSNISFMDSSGLGAIVAILKHIGNKGELRLVGPQKPVMDLFDLTCMDRIFKIHSNVSEAVL